MADKTNEFEQEKPHVSNDDALNDLLKSSQERVNVCPPGGNCGDVLKGEYIVFFKPNYKAEEVWSSHESLSSKMIHSLKDGEDVMEVPTIHRYDALNGIACQLSEEEAKELQKDKHVKLVAPNQVVKLDESELNAEGPDLAGEQPKQVVPEWLKRVGAEPKGENSKAVDGDVAVIDTGIDLKHPDLNVVENVTFVFGSFSGNDDQGHGTHVAGIIGAKNNDIGIVGVAPGVREHAVKVLNSQGSGTSADIVAGINWTKEHSPKYGGKITEANMSLGGKGSMPAIEEAITQAVDAGVTFCVASGNSHDESNKYSPASVAKAITVDAIADSDGTGGGHGDPPKCRKGEVDDKFASFSNFGPKNKETGAGDEIAAPGVCDYSTYKGQTYKYLSGTSMATPVVTGAAVRYQSEHKGATPAEIKKAIMETGKTQDDPTWGFTGDPDPRQRVLNVEALMKRKTGT